MPIDMPDCFFCNLWCPTRRLGDKRIARPYRARNRERSARSTCLTMPEPYLLGLSQTMS
jgi:hypothetical protein